MNSSEATINLNKKKCIFLNIHVSCLFLVDECEEPSFCLRSGSEQVNALGNIFLDLLPQSGIIYRAIQNNSAPASFIDRFADIDYLQQPWRMYLKLRREAQLGVYHTKRLITKNARNCARARVCFGYPSAQKSFQVQRRICCNFNEPFRCEPKHII